MKLPIRPSILIAVALAAAASAWIYSGQMEEDPFAGALPAEESESAEAPAAAPAEKTLPEVRVAESSASPHRAILIYTGRTEADRRATLRAETEGRVIEVAVDESQRVEKGAVIVKLAANDRYAILKQAQSLVRQREIEFDAAKRLAGKGYQTETARAQAEANLSSAEASLEQIRVDLARTTLEAPFAGTIESRAVEVGDYVQRGDDIAVLADFDPIVVTIQVAEKEISRVEDGVMAEIELISGARLTGIVSRVATSADPNTRTFEVELEVANGDATLLDGMTAKVLLPAQQVMAHRITPALLTLNTEGEVGVKTIDAENRVVFHAIEIVEDTAGAMWVSGLPQTATLITVGQAFVAPGALVKPVEDDGVAPPAPGDEPSPGISTVETSGERS